MDRLQSVKTTCSKMNGYSSVIRVIALPPEITITWKLLITDRVALVSSGIPGCSACRHGGSPIYSDGKPSLFIFRNQLRPIIITCRMQNCPVCRRMTTPLSVGTCIFLFLRRLRRRCPSCHARNRLRQKRINLFRSKRHIYMTLI